MLPTGGDGSNKLWWDATNRRWAMVVGNGNQLTVSKDAVTVAPAVTFSGQATFSSAATFSADVTIPGGAPQAFYFLKNNILQGQTSIFTASALVTGSLGTNMINYTRIPMVRSGSILGLTVYSENGAVDDTNNGALTCSVAVDGVNDSTVQVILTTGSVGHFIQAKDTSTFNGGQAISVTFTASADYDNSVTASASFMAAVLVEY